MAETIAYKLLTADQWDRLRDDGMFAGSPDDIRDGYIHLSTRRQLRGTLDRHFAGQLGVVLAEVDLNAVASDIRWEESRGGEDFPHLYDGLPITAVTRHWFLDVEGDAVLLPRNLDD